MLGDNFPDNFDGNPTVNSVARVALIFCILKDEFFRITRETKFKLAPTIFRGIFPRGAAVSMRTLD